MPATVTYGRVAHGADGRGRPAFAVRAVPHVAQRLKRVFARADAGTPGVIFIRDTLEVARDLAWFMERWPLAASDGVADYIAQRSDEHRSAEQAVAAILGGYVPPNEWREPAMVPRGYQLAADALVHRTGWLLLADDLGLGKTFTALLRLRDPQALPAVVVCPVHLCNQWLRELEKSLPWLRGHIATKSTPYDPAAKRGSDGRQPDVLIMSYAKFPGWADHLAGTVQTIVFEECHELRTGEGTSKWAAAANVSWKARYRIGCSATPVHGYGDEIWNVIAVLEPDALGAKDEFLREWCGGTAGLAGHRLVTDPAMLGGYLRDAGMMLARTRTELHMELPDPITIEQPVDTNHATVDDVAQQVADQARILVGEIDADFTARGRAAREIDWRLRQATGAAKAPYAAEFIKLLLESEERVVVWAWHREVYEILLHALRAYRPVLYTGTESPAMKDRNAAAFCGGGSRVLLMSLRSGAGLDGLQRWCSVGAFAELDWSPEAHNQCIGRLARDGQQATVVAYYLTSDAGTDPLMCDVLGLKRQQSVPIRRPDAPLFAGVADSTDRARRLAADVLARIANRAAKGARA